MTDDELRSVMRALRDRIGCLKSALDRLGFQFRYPDEAFPGVSADTEEVIAKVESEVVAEAIYTAMLVENV